MRTLTRLGLLCVLALPATAAAQEKRPDLVDVKAWRGTLTATGKAAQDKLSVGPTAMTTEFAATFTAEFVLDEFEDEPATWTGKLVASNLTVTSSTEAKGPDSSHRYSFTTSGPVEAQDGPGAKLTFHRERGWSLIVLHSRRKAEAIDVTTIGDKVFTEKRETTFRALPIVRKFPYPEKGFDLEGTAELTADEGGTDFPTIWKYTVHLWPADRAMLTLEIDDSPAYHEWRPSATRDGKQGFPLELKATVVSSDGKTPNKKVESFVWELEKTSREPGVSMNWPLNANDDRFDLELTTQGGMFTVAMDGQRVERAVQDGFSDTVTVLPFDWGGWADLKVTATLAGGEKLVGKIKGATEDGMRLPKRAVDSYVADVWKKGKPGAGPDDCDFDDVPAVPTHKGDGLSLYEEYRGFYEKGEHKEGTPGTKDLFVLDTTGGVVEGGLAKFQKESKIIIHRLDKGEMDPKERLINKNRAKGPHVVAQHGLLFESYAGEGYVATQPQGAASPGDVTSILVPTAPISGRAAPDGTPYVDVAIAHELLHAVGVRHHGDGDYEVFWKVVGDAVMEFHVASDGKTPVGTGVPIRIGKEDGTDITDKFIANHKDADAAGSFGTPGSVGVEQGESSGDDTCMMRYDISSAYVRSGSPDLRIIVQNDKNPEPVGYRICTSRTGTGINAASPGPSNPRPSRHGNAAPGRGACMEKIKVSDI